jgi:hypothetical protein
MDSLAVEDDPYAGIDVDDFVTVIDNSKDKELNSLILTLENMLDSVTSSQVE